MEREQLVKHLNGGEAFMPITKVLEEISFDNIGKRIYDLPYSFYEIFFHITYTQKDILDYIILDDYKTPKWPEGYWDQKQTPESEQEWEQLKEQFFKEREQLSKYIQDESNDLDTPVKNSDKHSLLRELLLVIEHNAHHTGQLILLLRLLGDHK
ncbi:DinB family protein [Zunongwangia endophytica]|uniref:DinB family protein n=1 Tax=Zunongwangia endophytica TaxID=1808945 RepID=A0ABV8H9X2_9FLAO|nr:DinB family protein [Zunongwangia endophytica]MDN3594929.1 DinB family protein [Zunongwangia endophytica]